MYKKIYVVLGLSRIIGDFFSPIILPLLSFLKNNNILFDVIKYSDKIKAANNSDNMYIGIFNFVELKDMPNNYIIINLEPIENYDEEYISKLKNSKLVLYYNKIQEPNKVNNNILYYPFPYDKSIENNYNLHINNYLYDICMIGSLNYKREQIYNELCNYYDNKKINIHYPNLKTPIYEKEFYYTMFSSKIMLISNYYNNDVDGLRILIYGANKVFFLYIIEDDCEEILNNIQNTYSDKIVTCYKKNMIQKVDFYLKNINERNKKIDEIYTYLTTNHNVNNFLNQNILNYLIL